MADLGNNNYHNPQKAIKKSFFRNTRKQNTQNVRTPQSLKSNEANKKRTNLYSVSLQMVKSKGHSKTGQALSSDLSVELKEAVNPKYHRTPPITAKSRNNDETVEEFFAKYIEHFKIINIHYSKHHLKTNSITNLREATSTQLIPDHDHNILTGRASQTPTKKLNVHSNSCHTNHFLGTVHKEEIKLKHQQK